MISLQETVQAEIRRRGRVTFAEYMAWALYHPRGGYYMGGPKTGRAGDFLTNVQVPLYAEALAECFLDMWEKLGCGRFVLVELGGNDGVLAERVLSAFAAAGREATYHLVEAGPASREAARRRLSRFRQVFLHASLDRLEHTAGVEGAVFSNEFFDALPFHRVVQKDGALRELFVVEENGRLVERPDQPSTPALAAVLAEDGVSLAEGQEAEVCLLMEGAVRDVGRLLARGFFLTVDYGAPAAALYDASRPQGTRRGFEKHALVDPLEFPGQRDITAHVNFTRLGRLGLTEGMTPVVYADQGPFLLAAAEKTLRAAVEGKPPRAREVRQLIDPRAFGGAFRFLVQEKNAGGVALAAAKAARLQRLGLAPLGRPEGF